MGRHPPNPQVRDLSEMRARLPSLGEPGADAGESPGAVDIVEDVAEDDGAAADDAFRRRHEAAAHAAAAMTAAAAARGSGDDARAETRAEGVDVDANDADVDDNAGADEGDE